jgi:hypothetical protein
MDFEEGANCIKVIYYSINNCLIAHRKMYNKMKKLNLFRSFAHLTRTSL